MGKHKKSNYQDDGVYYSNSTCDSSEKNYSLPDFDEQMKEVEEVPHQRTFKVEMHLALTPKGEKPVKIPVCVGEYASNRVLEVLQMSINARRVKQVIEAVLDNVIPEPVYNKPVSETLREQAERQKDNEVIVVVQAQEKKQKPKKGQVTIGNDDAGHFSDPNSEDYFGDEVPDETIQENDVPEDNSDSDLDPSEHEGAY